MQTTAPEWAGCFITFKLVVHFAVKVWYSYWSKCSLAVWFWVILYQDSHSALPTLLDFFHSWIYESHQK